MNKFIEINKKDCIIIKINLQQLQALQNLRKNKIKAHLKF